MFPRAPLLARTPAKSKLSLQHPNPFLEPVLTPSPSPSPSPSPEAANDDALAATTLLEGFAGAVKDVKQVVWWMCAAAGVAHWLVPWACPVVLVMLCFTVDGKADWVVGQYREYVGLANNLRRKVDSPFHRKLAQDGLNGGNGGNGNGTNTPRSPGDGVDYENYAPVYARNDPPSYVAAAVMTPRRIWRNFTAADTPR